MGSFFFDTPLTTNKRRVSFMVAKMTNSTAAGQALRQINAVASSTYQRYRGDGKRRVAIPDRSRHSPQEVCPPSYLGVIYPFLP